MEPSLRVRKDGEVFEKNSFWQREMVGFEKLLHEFRLNELWHLPSHFHQLSQCHWLEAISGIYPDILIPYFLALGRISTHATHSHSRYKLWEIRHLQMAVIQIVHQEIGISSYLLALIIETTFHLYFPPPPVIILKPVSKRFLKTPLKLITTVLQLLTTDIRRNLKFLYSRRTTYSVDFEILIKHIHTNETELYLNQTEASEKKENIFS